MAVVIGWGLIEGILLAQRRRRVWGMWWPEDYGPEHYDDPGDRPGLLRPF